MLAAACVVAALVAGGCATDSPEDLTGQAWVEPAWFAALRQDIEENALAWAACYEEFGFLAEIGPEFGVSFSLPYPSPPGRDELLDFAAAECMRRIGRSGWREGPIRPEHYERMLVSRECLIAHGHPVPEPPSLEVWLDMDGWWIPHDQAWEYAKRFPASSSTGRWAEMNEACPQPGPHIFMVTVG